MIVSLCPQTQTAMEKSETVRELVFQILRTRMSFRQAIQKALRANGQDMTFEMLQIMSRLWTRQGVSQQYLAEQTAKDKTCMTNLINNLEQKGWVVRHEDASDRRNRLIFLTSSGEAQARTVRPIIQRFYRTVAGAMDEGELIRCCETLKKVETSMNAL